MELKQAFATALRNTRIRTKHTQEDFSVVSSRTYISTLERGMKSPTLEKIDELAGTMAIHPLSLLMECYLLKDSGLCIDDVFTRIRTELSHIQN
jgi:transcriptional regulator with XRE-family HTH domain